MLNHSRRDFALWPSLIQFGTPVGTGKGLVFFAYLGRPGPLSGFVTHEQQFNNEYSVSNTDRKNGQGGGCGSTLCEHKQLILMLLAEPNK